MQGTDGGSRLCL